MPLSTSFNSNCYCVVRRPLICIDLPFLALRRTTPNFSWSRVNPMVSLNRNTGLGMQQHRRHGRFLWSTNRTSYYECSCRNILVVQNFGIDDGLRFSYSRSSVAAQTSGPEASSSAHQKSTQRADERQLSILNCVRLKLKFHFKKICYHH